MAPQVVKKAPRAYLVLCGVVLLLSAGLLLYSQTAAFSNDEGFHLLAAQLIGAGKRPYIDFFFPQTPLNAYWNAAWMGLFGQSWRVPHAVAALVVGSAVMLVADYVYRRFPDPAWSLPAAVTAALCFALNEPVVTFGTVQAYGLCLLLVVVAFRCGVMAAGRTHLIWAACAGCCASAAATASLLTAPIAPVLLAWLVWQTPGPGRAAKFLAFCAGALVPLLPLFWLFAHGTPQVLFDIVEYHGLYRQLGWPGAVAHNIDVYSAWIDSGQALAFGGLVAAALLLAVPAERFRAWRSELILAALLAGAEMAYLCSVIPTHERYFLLAVPFLAILAPAGLYVLAAGPGRRLAPVLGLAAFFALATARTLFDGGDDYAWSDAEEIAAKVDEVTPADGRIFAEESIYFLTRRTPPSGLEHADALKLSLTAPMNALLHLMPKEELARRIRAGEFATVELCEDMRVEISEPEKLFAESSEFDDCTVYWRFAPDRASQAAGPAK